MRDSDLFALIGEQQVLEAAYASQLPQSGNDALWNRVVELDSQIIDTRAGSMAGILWKVEEVVSCLKGHKAEDDYSVRMLQSVIADLQAMSKGQPVGKAA